LYVLESVFVLPRVLVAQSMGRGFVLTDAELWKGLEKPDIREGVLNFCSKDIKMVPDDGTITEALNVMAEEGMRMLPIVHKFTREVVGVVSERRVLKHLTLESTYLQYDEYDVLPSSSKGAIMSAMSAYAIDVSENESIIASEYLTFSSALNLIVQKQIGYLPIVDAKLRPVCVLAEDDLTAQAVQNEAFDFTLRDFISMPVATIKDTSRVSDVCRKIIEKGYRRIPVVDEQEKIRGVVTVRSLLKLFNMPESKSKFSTGRQDDVLNTPIVDIMSEKIVSTQVSTTVVDAEKMMRKEGVDALFIKDETGRLESIFTMWDVLRAYSGFLGTRPG